MNDSTPLLEVRDLAKRFGSVVALRSAALTVSRGEIHALMGANGAGKSTLVKILTGVFPADSGTIASTAQCRRSALPPKRVEQASSRSIRIRAGSRFDGRREHAIGRRRLRQRAQPPR